MKISSDGPRRNPVTDLVKDFSNTYNRRPERLFPLAPDSTQMAEQKVANPDSIIPRKRAVSPGDIPEKGLITLPGESEREIADLAGGTYLTTKLDTMVNWARGNSLWPLPFGTA